MATVTQRSAFTDAASLNDISRDVRQYRDLDLFFSKNQGNGDINKITGIEAVKRSIRNLVLLNFYEKPFHPEIASGVRDMLFENMTPFTAQALQRHITDVITNFEPRALLTSVEVIPRFDENRYDCVVEFYIENAPAELIDLSFTLERLR